MPEKKKKYDIEECEHFNLNNNITSLKWKDKAGRKKVKRPYIQVTLEIDAEQFYEGGDIFKPKGGFFFVAPKGDVQCPSEEG